MKPKVVSYIYKKKVLNMKKRVVATMILAFAMILATNEKTVFAKPLVSEAEYSVTYSASPIMNFDYIKDLSIQRNSVSHYSLEGTNFIEYELSQLIEVREYGNGSIEKDYVITKIAEPKNTETSTSFGSTNGNHSLTLAMYYTVKGTYRNYTYKLSKIVSTVVKANPGTVTVTAGSHAYRLNSTIWKRENFYFNNSISAGGQSFEMYTGNNNFYPSYPDALTASIKGVYADSSINLSNGKFITINLVPKEESD